MKEKVLVEAREVTKRFPGVLALDKVNLRIISGKVNALMGENGAGKSTLMNILSGVYTDYEGQVLVDGEVQQFRSVSDAQQKGIAIIHQELNLIPYLNVAENIFLGKEPLTKLGFIDRKRMHCESKKILKRLHLDVDTYTLIADLRVGQQQLVEIAKALISNANVLIMDEPTSSLSESETEILFKIIKELTEQGVGIVYISHKMDEVWRLADYVTILRDGKFISEQAMKDTCAEDIIQKMVGREDKDMFVKKEHEIGSPVLEVEHLCLHDATHSDYLILDNISFTVNKGEVLGIYGLMGSGRTELFETLFGLHAAQTSGIIRIEERNVQILHPNDAIAHGLALCPEDRKLEGLILDMPIKKNVTLSSLVECLSSINTINRRIELEKAKEYCKRLSIKTYSAEQITSELSGGNQQKIVLAKWLLTHPKVLLLDEPTRGIDINAKNEIYKLIDQIAETGMSVIVASSELPEIMAISDRIITLKQGRIGQTFLRSEFTEESILKASLPE